jgi:hypothetical protein
MAEVNKNNKMFKNFKGPRGVLPLPFGNYT